ncbi:MAG: PAS domain-containing protein [Lentisphaeria bacterium]
MYRKPLVNSQSSPHEDGKREKMLRRYRVTSSRSRRVFDDMVRLAAEFCNMPMADIGFFDRENFHIAFSIGHDVSAISRDETPAMQVLQERQTVIVNDTADNVEVRELLTAIYPGNTGFYAAIPLFTPDNYLIGVVEFFDYSPRYLTPSQEHALQILTGQVMNQLELLRSERERKAAATMQKSIKGISPQELSVLQNLIDRLPDLIYIKNKKGRYLLDNAAHRRFLVVDRLEDVVGKKVENFFPEKVASKYRKEDQVVMLSGEPLVSHSEPTLDPQGKTHHIATSKIPLHDEDGNVEGLLYIGRDKADSVIAEQALAQEKFLLHTLMDNIPDNIYFKDRDGRFIRINNSLASWFGLSDPTEATGKTDFDYFSAEHAQQAAEDEQEILQTGRPVVGKEEKETWPDGRVTWVSSSKEPLRDQQGNIVGTFGISRDITELKKATLELAARDQKTREEMNLARAIHSALLPVEAPKMPGFEFGLRFVPSSDIGGDFIDFVRLPDPNSIGVVFADITGHGVGAALLASMLKVFVDEVAPVYQSLDACFKALNRRLFKAYPGDSFASTFYAVFDSRKKSMTYVKASQEPVILLRPGQKPQCLGDGGPALGLLGPEYFDEKEYKQCEVQLLPGDTVFFYTDGLVDIHVDGRSFDISKTQLCDWLEELESCGPQELADTIYERALSCAQVDNPSDDVAVLAVRITEE